MLEFKKIDDETFYANDPDRHDIENPRAIIILYDVWAFDAEYSDALLSSSDCRQIADKLDELNGVETKFNPLSIIENTMESLDEERKRFKEIYDRTEAQINQGVRPAGKRFSL